MMRGNLKVIAATVLLALAAGIGAATDLPSDSVLVNPNYGNTTTIVTVYQGANAVTYRGPSAYYYVSECAKPDSSTYHCDIKREDGVVLTASDGSTVTVTLIVQFSAVLIRSGHNYWRNSAVVQSGTVQ